MTQIFVIHSSLVPYIFNKQFRINENSAQISKDILIPRGMRIRCLWWCLQFCFIKVTLILLVCVRIGRKDCCKSRTEKIYFQALANTWQKSLLLESGFQDSFSQQVLTILSQKSLELTSVNHPGSLPSCFRSFLLCGGY